MPKIEGYEIAYINAEGRPKVFITTETPDGSARAYFAAKHRNTEILLCRPLVSHELRKRGVGPGESREF